MDAAVIWNPDSSPNLLDRLIAARVVELPDGSEVPAYTEDATAALAAVDTFTRRGGHLEVRKAGGLVWEASAWRGGGRHHTATGGFASAVCRAMLAAVGVSVISREAIP